MSEVEGQSIEWSLAFVDGFSESERACLERVYEQHAYYKFFDAIEVIIAGYRALEAELKLCRESSLIIEGQALKFKSERDRLRGKK